MRRSFYLSLLLALFPLLLSFASALGCIPDDNDPRRCALPLKPLKPQPEPVILPTGVTPEQAKEPSGEWQYLASNTSVWYKIADGGLQLTIWVDANGMGGLALAIYAPGQQDLYGTPIGRGSFNRFEPHDLFWTGRTRAYGTWYAVVTNHNSSAVPFSLNYARSKHSVADRCSSCHGQDIEWERCVSAPGSSFCEDLRDEFGK